MREMNFCISDTAENFNNISFIYKNCHQAVMALGGEGLVKVKDKRAYFFGCVSDGCDEVLKAILLDRVSDVIAIGYKYCYFKKQIRTLGLCDFEQELLLAALIAADLKEDKQFILKKQKTIDNLPIDGLFNFQLGLLKKKWAEVVGYIPTYFSTEKLYEFISYIVSEKPAGSVTVIKGKAYDDAGARLFRGELMGYVDQGELIRELILADGNKITVDNSIAGVDERLLARFYGDKIFFKKGVNLREKS